MGETAKMERDYLIQKEQVLKEKYIHDLYELFAEMDEDGSGDISYKELLGYFDDIRVQSYFHALDMDPNDTERLFMLLDDDGSGDVNIDEFLSGCLRLKGWAKSMDIHQVIREVKRVQL